MIIIIDGDSSAPSLNINWSPNILIKFNKDYRRLCFDVSTHAVIVKMFTGQCQSNGAPVHQYTCTPPPIQSDNYLITAVSTCLASGLRIIFEYQQSKGTWSYDNYTSIQYFAFPPLKLTPSQFKDRVTYLNLPECSIPLPLRTLDFMAQSTSRNFPRGAKSREIRRKGVI